MKWWFWLFAVCLSSVSWAALPQVNVDAEYYLLMDASSGRVLAEKNADVAVSPASITKIMTAYVVYEALEKGRIALGDEVVISEDVWRSVYGKGYSIMWLEPRDRVSVEQLLNGLVIQSGNDAALALAEYVGGSESAFVQLMNSTAKELGLDQSYFTNVAGLTDPNHKMSARDMVRLTQSMIARFPEHYALYREKEYEYNDINQRNRNALLWRDDSVDGVKTGHTEDAGYCLVSSAKRGDMRLIAAVLGTDSNKVRTVVSQQLLNYGYRYFETHTLYRVGDVLTQARVWEGVTDEVTLGVAQDLVVTLERGQYDQLKAEMDLTTERVAPVKQGDEFGVVRLSLDDEVLLEVPLVAQHAVDQGPWYKRILDAVLRWFA